MRSIPQSAFVKQLGAAASPATVSRLFRGEVAPTEKDLHAFSEVLAIPIETLLALRIADSIPDRRMLATTGLLSYMINGTRTLLLAGFTLGLGIGQLRSARSLEGLTVLVDLMSPADVAAIELSLYKWPAGDALASWVSVARTLIALATRHQGCRIRLWIRTRQSEFLDETFEPPTGELIANDWIAFEAPPTYRLGHSFQVRFFGDSRWSALVEPLTRRLWQDQPFDGHRLLWDSAERNSDGVFRAELDLALEELLRLGVTRITS